MPRKLELTNQQFGKLKALKCLDKRSSFGRIYWECLCECGKTVNVVGTNLVNGNTKSCGCVGRERLRQMSYRDGRSFDPHYNLKLRLKNSYNLTLEEYDFMLRNQTYQCKICKVKLSREIPNSINVDHCHTSGKIRGLLCPNCNTALGSFKDNVDILQSAISYLNANKQ